MEKKLFNDLCQSLKEAKDMFQNDVCIAVVPSNLTFMVDYHKKQFAQTVINEADITGKCEFKGKDGYLHFVTTIDNRADYCLDNSWICSKEGLYEKVLELC
jgi:hypothetical protein